MDGRMDDDVADTERIKPDLREMPSEDENTRRQPNEADNSAPSRGSGDRSILSKGGGDGSFLTGSPGEGVARKMRSDNVVERAHNDAVQRSPKHDNCLNPQGINKDANSIHEAKHYEQRKQHQEFLDHAKKLQEEVKKQSSVIENLLTAKRQLQTELEQLAVREHHYRERAEYLEEKIQAITAETEETREQAKDVVSVHDKLQGQIEWLTQARDRAHRIKTTAMREKHRIQQELKLEQAKMDQMTVALREAKKQKLVADRRRIEMARYKDDLTKALEKERSRSTTLLESIETLKIQMIEAMKTGYH
ncbi:uncharacterized protein LOC118405994 [Branchiostoma floridae]|uniref:Uncharacterized protein LOC118405994 n=1 Tax=Branchiostoma floridae TaxID=7739 RepID=A0A9J7HQV0_BRAFL|nr:uncharacterized protein LOC118405994 [Branchiostoma floridae]